MPTPQLILIALILPAIISTSLTLLGTQTHHTPTFTVLSLTIGLLIAYRGMASQWPPFPPIESPERITLFAIPLSIIAILASWQKVPWPARLIPAIASPALIVWYVFKPLAASSMPPAQMCQWVAAASVIAFIIALLTEGIARKRPGVATPLVLGPLAAGIGAVLLLIGTVKLGWLGASIGMMVLGWYIAALLTPSANFSRGPVYVTITLLTGLLTYDYFDSGNITTIEIFLLCIAPVLACTVEAPPLRNLKPWKRELSRLILVSIPIAIAVTLAVIQFKKDSAASE